MKRVIVVTAALLASALSAHAAPVKKRTWFVNGRACHETVITKQSDAIRYVLSGQFSWPQWDEIHRCAPRTRDNANSDDMNRYLIFGIP